MDIKKEIEIREANLLELKNTLAEREKRLKEIEEHLGREVSIQSIEDGYTLYSADYEKFKVSFRASGKFETYSFHAYIRDIRIPLTKKQALSLGTNTKLVDELSNIFDNIRKLIIDDARIVELSR